MKKTLGGDRLGSGNKMQVDMHGYSRSTFDKSYVFRSSMAAGTLVPFLKKLALPGDTWDFKLDCDIKTHPTIGPLFGSYKVQLDMFFCPMRLYNGLLHNNTKNIGKKISQVKFPQIVFNALELEGTEQSDLDNSQVNPSSLPAYMGIRGIGMTIGNNLRSFNAAGILSYWDVYGNYYANKQEEIGAVLHTPAEALVTPTGPIQRVQSDTAPLGGITIAQSPATGAVPMGPADFFDINFTIPNTPKPEQILINTVQAGQINIQEAIIGDWVLQAPGNDTLRAKFNFSKYPSGLTITSWEMINPSAVGVGKPSIVTFPLTELDHMRNYILQNLGTSPVVIASWIGGENIKPYHYLVEQPNGIPNVLSSQEGLALKTYQSDIFNNWLNQEWIDGDEGVNELTKIDTSEGFIYVDTLILTRKVFNYLNRIMVSGGTLDDWQEATYDHRGFSKTEIPIYMGGLSKELIFQEVVSNSSTDGQPLGTLAGKGIMAKKHKGGQVTIKADEVGYIIGLVSLTPRIDYSQGNDWDVLLNNYEELAKPELGQIGFQDLQTELMAWWDTYHDPVDGWTQRSAGKQPAWINYMTDYNRCYGNFAIANNEMFMTLNRRYEPIWDGLPTIKDLTTYIDPSKYNFIFAQTALDAQNFWCQIGINATARRKMSSKVMPSL